MKPIGARISTLALGLAICLSPLPARALCVETGKAVPDVTLPSLDGQQVSLKNFRGKIVLISFWASWCPRCKEELTFLQGVHKTSPDIVVVAINQESQNLSKVHIDRIRSTLADWKVDFPVLLDRNLTAWNAFCIKSLPASVLLDKNGIVRWAEADYFWARQNKLAEWIQTIRLGR